jgi:hypothetical protein
LPDRSSKILTVDNCQDVTHSIPKLMSDEKNIEDPQKEGKELFLNFVNHSAMA